MSYFKVITIPIFLICFAFPLFSDQLIQEIKIKEGARKIIKLNVDTYLDQDPTIAKLVKTENANEVVVLGLSMGKTEIICKNQNKEETLLKLTVVPRYWNTLEYLFADTPNISLNITDGHLIISGKVIQNSLLKKVDEALKLDKERIINNVSFSYTDLLTRIRSYLKEESFDDIKVEAMDKTVYLSGNIFDKKKRDNLISVIQSYVKPAGCALNYAGIHLSGSPLTVEVRFASITRGHDDNIGITLDDIKSTMDFTPTTGHIYNSAAVPNVTRNLGISGTGEINTAADLNLQKIKNAMKILYDTDLSTRSGEHAKLQRGGTVYEKIEGVQAVDLKEIDFGFIVDITPTLLNKKTIDADVEVQVSGIEKNIPLTIRKYTMNAKYTVAPGEIILINKINSIDDKVSKQGIPILSDIPIISYMFENETSNDTNANLILLLRISLQPDAKIKEKAEEANKSFDKIQKTPTHVDMNFFESLVDELEDTIEEELK